MRHASRLFSEGKQRLSHTTAVAWCALLLAAAPSPVEAQREGVDTACSDEIVRARRPRASGEDRLAARRCINRVDSLRRATALRYAAPAVRYIAELPWHIPEYHDEQRLSIGGGNVGPMAYIYASPALGGFTDPAQFEEHGDRGVLVGVVSVLETYNGELLPQPYRDLGLAWGLNCIYLAYRGTGPPDERWDAYVTNSGTGANAPCQHSTSPTWLSVHATRTSSYGLRDHPPVARFGETRTGRPLLGIACLDTWCEIGPGSSDARPAQGSDREEKVKGWHDDQALSVWSPPGHYRRVMRAKVTPRRNVDQLTLADFADWQEVAIIRLDTAPPAGSKYEKWGLMKGKNTLELKLTGATWSAQVTSRRENGNFVTREWVFAEPRHPHVDAAVPGTARFRWTVGDEGVWVPCGQGCCKVEGIEAM